MADIKYYDVILKPVITEKSMAGMGEKKYTFLVHPDANKTQIKEAVEKMFDGAKVGGFTPWTKTERIRGGAIPPARQGSPRKQLYGLPLTAKISKSSLDYKIFKYAA